MPDVGRVRDRAYPRRAWSCGQGRADSAGTRRSACRPASSTATFLPTVGMTGVSLRVRGREHLALPGGVDHLRAGGTGGLPLLAPWANRLASRRYRVGRTAVDLTGLPVGTDDNGLPIHGLLVGAPGWRVDGYDVRGSSARLRASIDVDAPAFPFPHRIEILVTARDGELDVRTTVIPTGRRRVPIAFGWHPYLRLPGTPRRQWRLRMPATATSRPRRLRHPDRRRDGRGGGSRRRSVGGRSTTCTRSGGSAGSRSRPTTRPSSCGATRRTRTPRCGSRPDGRSPRSSR